jgi:hypothetical protein
MIVAKMVMVMTGNGGDVFGVIYWLFYGASYFCKHDGQFEGCIGPI